VSWTFFAEHRSKFFPYVIRAQSSLDPFPLETPPQVSVIFVGGLSFVGGGVWSGFLVGWVLFRPPFHCVKTLTLLLVSPPTFLVFVFFQNPLFDRMSPFSLLTFFLGATPLVACEHPFSGFNFLFDGCALCSTYNKIPLGFFRPTWSRLIHPVSFPFHFFQV